MRDHAAAAIDVALCALHGRRLAVLLVRDPAARARTPWHLPWAPRSAAGSLDDTAARVARRAAGTPARWLTQAGAFTGHGRHPGGAALSVAYVGVTPHGAAAPPGGAAWFPVGDLPTVPARNRAVVRAALLRMREQLDRAPVVFRLLGPTFTLAELQAVYELLTRRRLHKASFRRALRAAFLVEPTAAWRSEGRGRPAQLFRYAPRRGRGDRAVRFDLVRG